MTFATALENLATGDLVVYQDRLLCLILDVEDSLYSRILMDLDKKENGCRNLTMRMVKDDITQVWKPICREGICQE